LAVFTFYGVVVIGVDDAACGPVWNINNPFVRERTALSADATTDVLIVGAGYTGLWTAFHLLRNDPTTRVLLIDANEVGFGASGRNGGWCSAISPVSMSRIEKLADRAQAVEFTHSLVETVRRVGEFCKEYDVDAHVRHDGWMSLARNRAQLERVRSEVDEWRHYGFAAIDMNTLESGDSRLPRAEGVIGASFTPHCASVHPARLVHGLAIAVESLGGIIYHQTPALTLSESRAIPHHVSTPGGTITADVVIRATEGFTSTLTNSDSREIAPIYSLMIASEPLDDAWWEELGWRRPYTLNDARKLVIYGQRTADGRLAFGGRGAPYHFGSSVKPSYDLDRVVHRGLANAVDELFPLMRDVEVTHRWGGPLAITRDWCPFVRFDRATGFGTAGGYVGDGVATSALAGQTLAELIAGRNTPHTNSWWVNRPIKRWEREPFRWLGISAGLALPEMIDEVERDGGTAPRRAKFLSRLTGH
jgi:glycine/D-amino acid oxidase-like deaminating enzyme